MRVEVCLLFRVQGAQTQDVRGAHGPEPTLRHPSAPQCNRVMRRSRWAEAVARPGYALFRASTTPVRLAPSATWAEFTLVHVEGCASRELAGIDWLCSCDVRYCA